MGASDDTSITIDDTSPIFTYLPYSDGSIGGWATWYSQSGFNKETGELGQGDSWHLTNANGSSVSFSFYGDGFQLLGNSNASYDVIVDNGSPDAGLGPSTNILYSRSGMSLDKHTVTLTSRAVASDTILSFDKAVLSAAVGSGTKQPLTIQNGNTDVITYNGSWTSSNNTQIPSSSNPQPFRLTDSQGDSFTFSFTSTDAFAIYGSTNYGHAKYSVEIDGGPATVFNASTYWLVPNAVLYYQDGLEEDKTHTVKVTNVDPYRLSLNSIDFYGGSPVPIGDGQFVHKSKKNIGVIVGPVVGVVGFLLLVAGFFLFRYYRRRRGPQPEKVTTGRRDPESALLADTGVEPYREVTELPRSEYGRIPSSKEREAFGSPKSSVVSPSVIRTEPDTSSPPTSPPAAPPSQSGSGPSPTRSQITQPSGSGAASNPEPQVDIDRIMDLIAQRIDPVADPRTTLPPYRG